MADLRFEVEAVIEGSGRDREGVIRVDGHEVGYSIPAAMAGRPLVSPETLLLSAVAACYSLALLAILQHRKLPVGRIGLRAEGVVTGHPEAEKYARITVHPTSGRPSPPPASPARWAAWRSRRRRGAPQVRRAVAACDYRAAAASPVGRCVSYRVMRKPDHIRR